MNGCQELGIEREVVCKGIRGLWCKRIGLYFDHGE